MRLEGLNKTLNTIQAIAIAGGSMFSGDDKHKTSCVLFDHIQDLTADASDYYALHDMLAELEGYAHPDSAASNLTRGVCHE